MQPVGTPMDGKLIFVTGASGYIAKHIIVQLLEAGYRVRGSVRSLDRADAVRRDLSVALTDAGDLTDRLEFAALDLERDAGWDEALCGADALLHTASPFPLDQPRDRQELIRPAVEGTRRALRAAKAAGIERVVLTSSAVAILNADLPAGREAYNEEDWTDPSSPRTNAYAASKTMAERAAWALADELGLKLTTINPGLVLGRPVGAGHGSSVALVERILSGRDPAVPDLAFPLVDVRDIARMHVAALQRPESIGRRYIGSAGTRSFLEVAKTVKDAHPEKKIALRVAPKWLMRLLAVTDPAIRGILPQLGRPQDMSAARATEELGVTFRDPEQAVRDVADYLLAERRAA